MMSKAITACLSPVAATTSSAVGIRPLSFWHLVRYVARAWLNDLLAGARVTNRRAAGGDANREPLDDITVAAFDRRIGEHEALVEHENESDLDVRQPRALDLHAAVERREIAQRRLPIHQRVDQLLLGQLDLVGGLPFVLAAARVELRDERHRARVDDIVNRALMRLGHADPSDRWKHHEIGQRQLRPLLVVNLAQAELDPIAKDGVAGADAL